MRHERSDKEWSAIRPTLRTDRAPCPRLKGQWLLGAIFLVLKSGEPQRDLPELRA